MKRAVTNDDNVVFGLRARDVIPQWFSNLLIFHRHESRQNVQLQTYPLSTYHVLGSEDNNNNNSNNGQYLYNVFHALGTVVRNLH